MKELYCEIELEKGFELAIVQLGYVIVGSWLSDCGRYRHYQVDVPESEE